MFDNEFPPLGGGTGIVNLHLLEELSARPEVWVDLVTSSRTRRSVETETFAPRITIYKVPVDNRNIHHATNLELLRYLRRGYRFSRGLMRQHSYDLSFAFAGVPAGAISYALRARMGLPYLLSLQGPDIPGFEARYNYLYPALRPIVRRIWKAAGAVTVMSDHTAELARVTMKDLKAEVIPNAVDTRRFTPSPHPFEGRPLNFLCVGRLIERKGQHHLLKAFADLRTRHTMPMSLTLAGTGDAEPELRALAGSLDLNSAVAFAGAISRDAMPEAYRRADVFVLPSFNEGMSMALLEALASGLPVVVTGTGGTAELVRDGENGFIVPWADVPALSRSLERLAVDSSLRIRMGRQSRSRAEAFGWGTFADRHLELCDRIMRDSSQRAPG